MIWIFILGVSGICLLLGLLRAKNDCLRATGKCKALEDSRAAFEAAVQKQAADSLENQLSVFRTSELRAATDLARNQAKLEYDQKLAREIEKQRAEAIKQSKAVNRGLVAEQLAPHMVGFPYSPKDCHFLGQPCDYVIFDGLDSGELKRIVLLEVKTGKSQPNARERQVRAAVDEARVQYDVFRLDTSDFT